ncbi:MAG: alpha/beta hydrolase [Candidatus Caenarcaniphilales bacterium]|nr:alpha/beta hydrolase [Candidatus Caenarcaniphilales bacterium]
MLFVTSQAKKNGRKSKIGEEFIFDEEDNEVGKEVYFCDDKAGKKTEIGAEALLTRLKDSQAKELLIYFHGFNVQPDDAIENGRKMQRFFNEQEYKIKVVPFIWPCGNKLGFARDYYDDQDAADASRVPFARMIAKFMDWQEKNQDAGIPCLKRINVLAHSMGNRVFRNSMSYWSKRFAKTPDVPFMFRNTFLVAADVANHTLEKGKLGNIIAEASRNVVTYFASDDLALRGSKAANVKNGQLGKRLGHSGPENIKKPHNEVPENVYAIDCNDVNTDYDKPLGHSYYIDDKNGQPNKVFKHIEEVIRTGRVETNDKGIARIKD